MSNADELRVSLIEESTPGVTPATPTMLVLPTTGQSLQDIVRYVESRTIRNNRNVTDAQRVSRSSGGGLPCEMRWAASTEALYHVIRAALCAVENAEVVVSGGTPNATVIGGTGFVQRFDGVTWESSGVIVGDVVRFELTGLGVDNGAYGIVIVTAGTDMQVWIGRNFAATVAGVTVRRGARMDNGTTHRHFSIEVSRLDIGKHYLLKKQVINTLDLSVSVGGISTLNFGTVGGSTTRGDSAIGSAYTDPANRPVMDSVNVPLMLVAAGAYDMSNFGLSITNNAVPRERIGLDSVGTIRRGKFRVTGNAEWYFDDFTEFNKFVDNQSSYAVFVQQDASRYAWSWYLPNMKWTNVVAATEGPDTDDMFKGQFLLTELGNISLRCQRFTNF